MGAQGKRLGGGLAQDPTPATGPELIHRPPGMAVQIFGAYASSTPRAVKFLPAHFFSGRADRAGFTRLNLSRMKIAIFTWQKFREQTLTIFSRQKFSRD